MTAETINIILAYSCTLPAVVGLLFYKRMDKCYHPFIWAMWLSVFSETTSRFILPFSTQPLLHICLIHVYYLLHFYFFLLLFYRLEVINKSLLKNILIFGCIIFFVNAMFKPVFFNLLGEKTIAFYLIIFYFAVKLLTLQIFNHNINIGTNALFFIGCGLLMLAFPILQNIIRIIVRYFYNLSTAKITVLQYVFVIANAVSYILFFIATIYIPKKLKKI